MGFTFCKAWTADQGAAWKRNTAGRTDLVTTMAAVLHIVVIFYGLFAVWAGYDQCMGMSVPAGLAEGLTSDFRFQILVEVCVDPAAWTGSFLTGDAWFD